MRLDQTERGVRAMESFLSDTDQLKPELFEEPMTNQKEQAVLGTCDTARQKSYDADDGRELIDVYEVHATRPGVDFTVIRESDHGALYDAIWNALDNLERGESITITYQKYTQDQMDEVYEDE